MMLFLELVRYALVVLLTVILGVFVAACVYIYQKHERYKHLPGPKRSSFFQGNLELLRKAIGERQIPFIQAMLEVQQEHGPVFVIYIFHQAFVFICDPVTVKKLLMNTEHRKQINEFCDVYGVRFLGRGLVTEQNHSKWHARRKIFNPAFHRKQLKDFMGYFNTSSDKLVLKLMRDADTDMPVELMDGLCRTTLDVIATAGFGMKEEHILEDSPFIDAIETAMKGMRNKLLNPSDWMNLSHWTFRRQVQKSLLFLRSFGKETILKTRKEQSDGENQTNNILTNILKYFDLNKDEFDMETMIDDFVTFFVAGQETTSNLLGFALLEMGKRPEITKKIREEIDSVVGDKEFVEYEDVMKMEYTSLVLKETLRLYPPVSGTARDCAYDIEACGYRIPAGTTCQLHHFIMSRMEQFFKNPLEFDPDRFLRDDDTPLYAYFPFSLGTRSCIGQQFALIEARVIIAKLLQNFNFKLDPTQSFELLDQLTLKPKGLCSNFIYSRKTEAA